jgi:hypothetical protein
MISLHIGMDISFMYNVLKQGDIEETWIREKEVNVEDGNYRASIGLTVSRCAHVQ